ncbi:hypothetical protein HW132_35415 [Brasilonema sp. CT11]|nr:hypothetical protein [Brasilonema sp. CT11]
MALGKRINRVIKANINSAIGYDKLEGAASVGAGALGGAGAHAVIGNVGLAAKGTAIGLYAPHFVVAGAVVGAAAYGASKICK